jgi:hypothetical protein
MLTDTYIFFGGLLIALCAPLVLGLVPPNNWYGIRLPAFATPDKWYPLQRRGGLVLLLLGIALVATGILLHWVAPLSQRVQILLTVLLIPIFYTTMVAILIGASRMLR